VRVLVTGAGGFIGGVVADTLAAAGHQVTALVRDAGTDLAFAPTVEVVGADLRDPAQLSAAGISRGFDAVCHLAALTRVRESRQTPLRYFDTNVTGTVNLLAALEHGTEASGIAPAFVLGSSCAVYGEPGRGPIPETLPPAPANPYGATKLAAEQAVAYQAVTGRLGAVVLRSFNVAGGVQGHVDRDSSRIIPAALAVAAGREEVFRVNGDGRAVREYVHVRDIAQAYVAAVAAASPGSCRTFNVGSGIGISVDEVLATVERVTGQVVRRVSLPPVAEPQSLVADSRRIRAELGWDSPSSTIETIIADAWAWSYQHPEPVADRRRVGLTS
jgi:UDP-glucose 4-epimerase